MKRLATLYLALGHTLAGHRYTLEDLDGGGLRITLGVAAVDIFQPRELIEVFGHRLRDGDVVIDETPRFLQTIDPTLAARSVSRWLLLGEWE